MKILGKVKNSQVQVQKFFLADLAKWEGKEVEIDLASGNKTLQQLRYLWGVIYRIVSDHTGFTPEEVSEIYKTKFLTYEKKYKGKMYKLTKGLSGLKKTEMVEFIDKVIKHATIELSLTIPEPEVDKWGLR